MLGPHYWIFLTVCDQFNHPYSDDEVIFELILDYYNTLANNLGYDRAYTHQKSLIQCLQMPTCVSTHHIPQTTSVVTVPYPLLHGGHLPRTCATLLQTSPLHAAVLCHAVPVPFCTRSAVNI